MDSPYKVQLEVFEGPLDLLLYLIKKNEVDVYNIPIERITNQYLEYLELMRMLDLNIAGEFLVMAATLIYIKSKMLLPLEERPIEEKEEEDPRLDLVKQLLEYKKFKDVAGFLREKELFQEKVFGRNVAEMIEKTPDMFLSDVNIFDLISAFSQALKRVEKSEVSRSFKDTFTVVEKIKELKERILRETSFSLNKLFEEMQSRIEVVVTFLALLELIRLKSVRVNQDSLFGEIMVYSNVRDEQKTEQNGAATG